VNKKTRLILFSAFSAAFISVSFASDYEPYKGPYDDPALQPEVREANKCDTNIVSANYGAAYPCGAPTYFLHEKETTIKRRGDNHEDIYFDGDKAEMEGRTLVNYDL